MSKVAERDLLRPNDVPQHTDCLYSIVFLFHYHQLLTSLGKTSFFGYTAAKFPSPNWSSSCCWWPPVDCSCNHNNTSRAHLMCDLLFCCGRLLQPTGRQQQSLSGSGKSKV